MGVEQCLPNHHCHRKDQSLVLAVRCVHASNVICHRIQSRNVTPPGHLAQQTCDSTTKHTVVAIVVVGLAVVAVAVVVVVIVVVVN